MYKLFLFLIGSSAVKAILSVNPVVAVLWLTVVFLSSATILVGLGASFFGFVLIIVYLGAIAILFLFVIMTIRIRSSGLTIPALRLLYPLWVVLLGISCLFVETDSSFSEVFGPSYPAHLGTESPSWPVVFYMNDETDVVTLGTTLYTVYVPFLLATSMVFLVAIVAAIFLIQTHEVQETK